MSNYIKNIFYAAFILLMYKNVSAGCPQSRPTEEDSSALSTKAKKKGTAPKFEKEDAFKEMERIKSQDPQRLQLRDKCIVDIAASYGDPTALHILRSYYNGRTEHNVSFQEPSRGYFDILLGRD